MPGLLIRAPSRARRGEVIELKVLVSHVMETGYRHTPLGEPIARNILRLFTCSYAGEEVFRAELHPAIAANPYLAFFTVAQASGTLRFTFTGDHDVVISDSVHLDVE